MIVVEIGEAESGGGGRGSGGGEIGLDVEEGVAAAEPIAGELVDGDVDLRVEPGGYSADDGVDDAAELVRQVLPEHGGDEHQAC